MIITFPVLVSKTVDTEILPYLLKVIERKFALAYLPVLQDIVRKEMMSANNSIKNIECIILENEDYSKSGEQHFEATTSIHGIQVITAESNKLNSDQPYFLTLRITTTSRVTQDYVFGFKTLALVTDETYDIFVEELDKSRYLLNRLARKLLGEKFLWKIVNWYKKVFRNSETKTKKFETQKILFEKDRERIAILSSNDIDKEDFENADPDDTPLSSGNLKDSRWSSLYIDDSLNKRFYSWDQDLPMFSNVISYDILYKTILGMLPEQVDKAKERNTSMFSKRVPQSFVIQKLNRSMKKKR